MIFSLRRVAAVQKRHTHLLISNLRHWVKRKYWRHLFKTIVQAFSKDFYSPNSPHDSLLFRKKQKKKLLLETFPKFRMLFRRELPYAYASQRSSGTFGVSSSEFNNWSWQSVSSIDRAGVLIREGWYGYQSNIKISTEFCFHSTVQNGNAHFSSHSELKNNNLYHMQKSRWKIAGPKASNRTSVS